MMRLLLVMLAFLLGPTLAWGQERELTLEEVKQLAAEAVQLHAFEYDVPKFAYNSQARTVWWAWGNYLLPVKDPIDYVIREQARLEVFNLGFGPNWAPLTTKSESIIADMYKAAYDPSLSVSEKTKRIEQLSKLDRYNYEKSLYDWGRQNNWTYEHGQSSADAWRVRLVTNPPGGTIYLAHVVRYRAARLQGKSDESILTKYTDGSAFIWTGQHMIAATFPDGSQLPLSSMHLQAAGTVIITPTAVLLAQDQ